MQRQCLGASTSRCFGNGGLQSRKVAMRAATTERSAPPARQPRQENEPGSFFVDHTCIDCDTCRWMSPDIYARVNGQTAVQRQPNTDEERRQALQALLACPTFSIHCEDRKPGELRAAVDSFPLSVDGCDNIYHCGFASEQSYGATSYLVVREGGNVLVDSPRFDARLLKNIQSLGGARYMFLSHQDDVADHMKWASALGCERIIHEAEVNDHQQTTHCETQLSGDGPWQLADGGDDISLISVPGHTLGSLVLLHRPSKSLFTGDHLAFEDTGELTIMRQYNSHSVREQLRSALQLADLDVLRVLPGHDRRGTFADAADRRAQLEALVRSER